MSALATTYMEMSHPLLVEEALRLRDEIAHMRIELVSLRALAKETLEIRSKYGIESDQSLTDTVDRIVASRNQIKAYAHAIMYNNPNLHKVGT